MVQLPPQGIKVVVAILWGFCAWREVTLCETAWHYVDATRARFVREQLAGEYIGYFDLSVVRCRLNGLVGL